METNQKHMAAAGFIIGLVAGLALAALAVGGYVVVRGTARPGRPVVRRQYVTAGQQMPPAQNVPPQNAVPLSEGNLLVYEPFDAGTVEPAMMVRPPELVSGQYGEALHLYIDAPLIYQVPGTAFLREATVMGWVRIDNQQDRSFIWAYSRCYPSTFNYPDHAYKLGMHFLSYNRACVSSTLIQAMQPGRFYHLAQAWGPDGFRTYLDGVPLLRDTNNRQGNLNDPDFTEDDALYLGSYPGVTGNETGPGYKINRDGIYVDDFAVFDRQLTDGDVAGIARGGAPLADLLQLAPPAE